MSNAKLKKWLNRINQKDLPIFKHSLETINKLTADDDTSINELANAVLRDANLTARVLRLANSFYYNPSNVRISTITNAVMLLGFNIVRDICLSLAIIDALIKGPAREYILKLMAQSFHAAVQARAIAKVYKDESAEEIFIATLLFHLGEMTFFCTAKNEADHIIDLLTDNPGEARKIQLEELGFSFDDLTVQLTQDWHLSDILHDAILNTTRSKRTKHITLGNELAFSASNGWNSAAVEKQLVAITNHLGIPLKDTIQFAHKNAEMAISLARDFGADAAAILIPTVHVDLDTASSDLNTGKNSPYPMADPMLQLSILRELSSILSKKPALNQILEMVLEGMYRGIGLDRTVLALITPDKTRVRAKFILGADTKEYQQKFVLSLHKKPNDLLHQMQLYQRSYWVKNVDSGEHSELITNEMRHAFEAKSFYICPLAINNKTIGFFYADRMPSGRQLDQEGFESFKHFTQEAIIAIKFSQQS